MISTAADYLSRTDLMRSRETFYLLEVDGSCMFEGIDLIGSHSMMIIKKKYFAVSEN